MVGFEYQRHSYSKLKNNVIRFAAKNGGRWPAIPIIDQGPIPRLCPNFGLCACAKLKYSLLAQYHNTPLLPPSPPPKKKCIGIVLDFPWDIFMFEQKLQTMIMQKKIFFGGGGVKEMYYGICASRELQIL